MGVVLRSGYISFLVALHSNNCEARRPGIFQEQVTHSDGMRHDHTDAVCFVDGAQCKLLREPDRRRIGSVCGGAGAVVRGYGPLFKSERFAGDTTSTKAKFYKRLADLERV